MRKLTPLFFTGLFCAILTSCQEPETIEIVNSEIENSETPDNKEDISVKMYNCTLTDLVLFDTPVNNNLSAVNRSSYGMGNWKLIDELSDEFNYPGGKSSPDFANKWKLGFVNNYTGPSPTVWSGDQVTFETTNGSNRDLVLKAVETGTGTSRRLKCGMLSTKAKSSYPLFQEARVKISNSQLANAVWMLSDDPGTTEEIDNLEAYGPRIRANGTQCDFPYFGDRIHLSHHTFKQENGVRLDYQPHKDTWMSRKKDNSSCSRDNEVVWSENYHYFGVKWESPSKLIYFIDGKRVKIIQGLRADEGIDPEYYTTCGDGLTREMHMIISQASQAWRYGGFDGFWNSSDSKTGNDTKMRIDWIRVYSPSGNLNQRSCN